MAVYYLITSALIANLYTRYCDALEDNNNVECDEDDDKFALFPVFGFFIMVAWVSVFNNYNYEYTDYYKCIYLLTIASYKLTV